MKNIFIGYILIFFHFKINGFDLLPDFVGYILIVVGLGQLAAESEQFVKAKSWAIVMAIASAFFGIVGLLGVGYSFALSLVSCVFSCIGLYLMYLIGHGIRETEQKHAIDMGGEKFLSLWKVQAVLTLACQVLSLLLTELTLILVSILGVCAIIANIVFLVYLHRARKALETAEPEQEVE